MTPELKAAIAAGREKAKQEKLAALGAAPRLTDQDHQELLSRKQVGDLVEQMVEERIKQALARITTTEPQEQPQGTLSNDKLVKALLEAAAKRDGAYDLIEQDFIPDGDKLEKPKVYYTPTQNWNLWNKRVGNHLVPPPFGWKKIPFKMARAWCERSKSRRGLDQKFIATFECWSNTISQWIESCPEYNRIIFLDLQEAMSVSANLTFQETYAKHYGALDMTYGELTKMAPLYHIPTSASYSKEDYRTHIAEARAKQELGAQAERLGYILQEGHADTLLAQSMAPTR